MLWVSRKFSCVWIWPFRFLIQIQVWLGLFFLINRSVSNQRIKKDNKECVFESLNWIVFLPTWYLWIGYKDDLIFAYQCGNQRVLFFADVVAVLCCIGPYKPTSHRPKHVHSGQLYLGWSWQIMTIIGSCSLWQSISLGRIWDSLEPEASEKCNGIQMESKQRQPTKGSQSQQLCFFKFEWNSWALHKQCSMGLVDLQW